MHFKGQSIRQDKELQKNTLYQLNCSQQFTVNEKDDSTDVIDEVKCNILISDKQEAVFGREYRAPYVEETGEKRADLMCIMIDDINALTETYIYEIKHAVSGYDRVLDILGQLYGSIRQNESMLFNVACEKYKENKHIGVITTRINEDSLNRRIDEIKYEEEDLHENSSKLPRTVSKKKSITLLTKAKEMERLSLFLQHKMIYDGAEMPIEIIYLSQSIDTDVYECQLEMAIHYE